MTRIWLSFTNSYYFPLVAKLVTLLFILQHHSLRTSTRTLKLTISNLYIENVSWIYLPFDTSNPLVMHDGTIEVLAHKAHHQRVRHPSGPIRSRWMDFLPFCILRFTIKYVKSGGGVGWCGYNVAPSRVKSVKRFILDTWQNLIKLWLLSVFFSSFIAAPNRTANVEEPTQQLWHARPTAAPVLWRQDVDKWYGSDDRHEQHIDDQCRWRGRRFRFSVNYKIQINSECGE